LQKFREVIGCGYIEDSPKILPNRKPAWTWRCAAADDVRRVLEAIVPYLGARRTEKVKAAFIALDALPGVRPFGTRHWKAKVTEADVAFIRDSTQTQNMLARMFNISQAQVSSIKLRQSWAHVA
jgi:hypothetical protein